MAMEVLQTASSFVSLGTSVRVDFTVPTHPNSLIVVCIASNIPSNTVVEVTDPQSNVYVRDVDFVGYYMLEIWSARKTLAIDYVDVSFSFVGTGDVQSVCAFEISNIAHKQPSTVRRSTGTWDGVTQSLEVTSFSPAVQKAICIAACAINADPPTIWTAGTNFTLGGVTDYAASQYRIVTDGSAQTAPISSDSKNSEWDEVAVFYYERTLDVIGSSTVVSERST